MKKGTKVEINIIMNMMIIEMMNNNKGATKRKITKRDTRKTATHTKTDKAVVRENTTTTPYGTTSS